MKVVRGYRMKRQIKIELLPHTPFLKEDGTFDRENALLYSAKLAGECYEPEGWSKLKTEDIAKSTRRLNLTLGLEHTTPYEHINISFEASNIPKILAMILNNERQCATSEKSLRYTKINPEATLNLTPKESMLYEKWFHLYKLVIKKHYGQQFSTAKIEKLAQENSRYLVSVFVSTKMIHTIPWVQLNRIVSFLQLYLNKTKKTAFERKLAPHLNDFISALKELNLLDERAVSNRKQRTLSLFAKREVTPVFGSVYATNYVGSWAQLAQAQRHRTLKYSMQFLPQKTYYIPPILKGELALKQEWLADIKQLKAIHPQGELISINESGDFQALILKAQERLCTAAQLEIMLQTRATLLKYKEELVKQDNPLKEEIDNYLKGARCTFPNYSCAQDCKFKAGKNLTRKI